jgi:hypothetical protein
MSRPLARRIRIERSIMTRQSLTSTNRRQLIAAAGGGLAVALAAMPNRGLAQAANDYSDHPMTGMWLAMANPALPGNPPLPAPSLFTAEGYVVLQFPPIDIGANGPVIQGNPLGVWEPYDEQTAHFTVVQSLSAPDGTLIGSVTINGFPSVNDDNMTFTDRAELTHVTIRDANGAILQEIPGDPSGRRVTGIRMAVDAPGFPEAEATPAATPAS